MSPARKPSGLIRRVRVWDAEGRCPKGHLHFARSQDGAKWARAIVQQEIDKCSENQHISEPK